MTDELGLGEDYARNYAKGSLKSYLDGKKNLNWVMGMIKTSIRYKLPENSLADIFSELKGYGDSARYQEAYEKCEAEGLL